MVVVRSLVMCFVVLGLPDMRLVLRLVGFASLVVDCCFFGVFSCFIALILNTLYTL